MIRLMLRKASKQPWGKEEKTHSYSLEKHNWSEKESIIRERGKSLLKHLLPTEAVDLRRLLRSKYSSISIASFFPTPREGGRGKEPLVSWGRGGDSSLSFGQHKNQQNVQTAERHLDQRGETRVTAEKGNLCKRWMDRSANYAAGGLFWRPPEEAEDRRFRRVENWGCR